MKDGMKKLIFLVVLLAMTMSITGSAMAQGSSDPYLNLAGQVQGQVDGSDDGNGSLPFTGLDIALVAGGGLLLLGAGIAMRRIAPGTRSA
jgi:hypothetical protein